MAESENPSSRYPQINVNTGVSFAVLVALAGGLIWLTGIKNDVNTLSGALGFHERRLSSVENAVSEIRMTADSTRNQQMAAETKSEVRLVRIEIMLQDVLSRLTQADRK